MKIDRSNIRTGAEFLQACRDSGGEASDGPLDFTFIEGWAIHPAGGGAKWTFPSRAHWWKRMPYTGEPEGVLYEVETMCGRFHSIETTAIRLFGPGNVARCRNCAKRAGLLVLHRVR